MSNLNKVQSLLVRRIAGVFAFVLMAGGAWAQDTTTTNIKNGVSSFDTQVKNAEVVYVEGNDVVLKLSDGRIEHLIVPDSDKFTIDGNDVTVRELTPGTKLTQTITTTTAPRYVTTVRTLKGKVWHVNPHTYTVFLTVPGGENQAYTIPKHATFTINGKKATVHDLRKGMAIEATIVTDDVHTVTEQSKSVVGQVPMAPPETPREVGVLLIMRPMPTLAIPASSEEVASTLPKTGTSMPLVALLGALALAMSLGVGAARRALIKV